MTEEIIKRRSKNGLLFYSEDRRYKSPYYTSNEQRDLAITKYLIKKEKDLEQAIKERLERIRKEKELLNFE